ncbi:hypothetical protein FMEXI_3009 [Fusarium mexicanum]|uniref:Uncharacterized protein n=1 Tax=Fusarium mexicanum TaxID=751941 RepID=A0A8H5N3E4_9HYPO|nr:hypothetical protein FMEXI_3009 [Fusarium mexicanum]
MPDRLPDVSGLLALLERYRTPKRSGLPGGFATEEEIAFAERDSPIKGEHLQGISRNFQDNSPGASIAWFMIERQYENQRNCPRATLRMPCPASCHAFRITDSLLNGQLFKFSATASAVVGQSQHVASPQIHGAVELPPHMPYSFIFAAPINLPSSRYLRTYRPGGLVSLLMVAISYPVLTTLYLSFEDSSTATLPVIWAAVDYTTKIGATQQLQSTERHANFELFMLFQSSKVSIGEQTRTSARSLLKLERVRLRELVGENFKPMAFFLAESKSWGLRH